MRTSRVCVPCQGIRPSQAVSQTYKHLGLLGSIIVKLPSMPATRSNIRVRVMMIKHAMDGLSCTLYHSSDQSAWVTCSGYNVPGWLRAGGSAGGRTPRRQHPQQDDRGTGAWTYFLRMRERDTKTSKNGCTNRNCVCLFVSYGSIRWA